MAGELIVKLPEFPDLSSTRVLEFDLSKVSVDRILRYERWAEPNTYQSSIYCEECGGNNDATYIEAKGIIRMTCNFCGFTDQTGGRHVDGYHRQTEKELLELGYFEDREEILRIIRSSPQE